MSASGASRLRLVSGPASPVEVESVWRLATLHMTLRRAVENDRKRFIAAVAASRESLDLHCPIHRPHESDADVFDRMLRRDGGDGPGHRSLRLLGVLTDGRIAGGFNLLIPAAGLERTAAINWWIASDLRGHGLATEGVAALVCHALADDPPYGDGLGLHRLDAWVTRDNAASIRVAEKTGFVRREQNSSHLRTGERWVMHDLYTCGVTDGG